MTLHQKLVHILTEYDRKQSTKKNYNRYALAHYFNAVKEVEARMKKGEPIETALKVGFCGPLLRHIAKKLELNVEYKNYE